jgi:rhodanese-related sulfurtransferase
METQNDGIEQSARRRVVLSLVSGFVLGWGAAFGVWAADTPASLSGVKIVSAEEATKMFAQGVPLIDTRVATEYADKTIKGAKSVPYREKSAKDVKFDRSQDQFDLSKLPSDKNAPLVLFCNSGECWKSYKASVVARDAGYKQVHWLRGGLPEWVSQGLPTQ